MLRRLLATSQPINVSQSWLLPAAVVDTSIVCYDAGMRVREWVKALADRLGLTEERMRRAFILEVVTLPEKELRELAKVNPQRPERLSTAQADVVVVECLESAAERMSRERGRPIT